MPTVSTTRNTIDYPNLILVALEKHGSLSMRGLCDSLGCSRSVLHRPLAKLIADRGSGGRRWNGSRLSAEFGATQSEGERSG